MGVREAGIICHKNIPFESCRRGNKSCVIVDVLGVRCFENRIPRSNWKKAMIQIRNVTVCVNQILKKTFIPTNNINRTIFWLQLEFSKFAR